MRAIVRTQGDKRLLDSVAPTQEKAQRYADSLERYCQSFGVVGAFDVVPLHEAEGLERRGHISEVL